MALAVATYFSFNPTVDVITGLSSYDETIEITGDCEIASSDESVATAEIIQLSEENFVASMHFINYGTTEITFTDADGNVRRYEATCEKSGTDAPPWIITVEPID